MPRAGKKGFAPWTKAAHIKPGTHGSSNEISLSVLDAAKNAMDSQHGVAPTEQLGVIKLYTGGSDKVSTIAVTGETLSGAKVDEAPVDRPRRSRRHAAKKNRTLEKTSPSSDKKKQAGEKPLKEKRKKRLQQAPAHQAKKVERKVSSKVASKPRKSAKDIKPEKTAEEKAAAKQRRRRIERIVGIVALCVVFVLSLGAGIHSAYDNYQVQQGKIAFLDQGVSQISLTDETLAQLNEALSDPKSAESQATMNRMKTELPQTKIVLQRALSLLEKGEEGLEDSRDRELVLQARKGIEARQQMIDSGLIIIDKLQAALAAQEKVDSYWTELLDADAKARTNASLLQDPTGENLERAYEGLSDIITSLKSLKGKMAQADNDSSYIDLSLYEKYIELRMVALESAQDAIIALMEEDLDVARSKQTKYSEADEAAVEWAKKLPSKPSDIVAERYTVAAQNDVDAYAQARTDAGIADSKLRNYYSS